MVSKTIRRVFLFIPIFLISFFIIVPTVWSWVISFYSSDGDFGFFNYKIFANYTMINISNFPSFPLGAVIHNIIWVLISLPLAILLGLVIATFTHGLKGGVFFRWIFFSPLVIPGVVGGTLGNIIFHNKSGIVPAFFRAFGIESLDVTWYSRPQLALFSCILIGIMGSVAYSTIFYSAGVDAIPKEVTEAAKIDGASSFKILTKIHWPMLRPITLTLSSILLMTYFRTFDVVYVMTRGGPGEASNVLGLSLYFNAFYFLRQNTAAAIGVVLFLVSLVTGYFIVKRMVL